MDYIDRLTELRLDHDITQQAIADLLGCKQSAVSKYEKRRADYHAEDVIKLCSCYKVSADYIFSLPKDLSYPKR